MTELQFDQTGLTKSACQRCRAPIAEEYFTNAGVVICTTCHGMLSRGSQLSPFVAFLRACLFGGLTALASALVAFMISYITDYELGIVWLFLGALIGASVHKGSESRGGWSYSLLAVSLTYAAIGLSLSLLVVTELRRDHQKDPDRAPSGFTALVPNGLIDPPSPSPAAATPSPAAVSKSPTASPAPRQPVSTKSPGSRKTSATPKTPATPQATPTEESTPTGSGLGFGLAAVFMILLVLIGTLVMPVIVCISSPISILIYGFGLHSAWKACIHQPLALAGPFQLSSEAVAPHPNVDPT